MVTSKRLDPYFCFFFFFCLVPLAVTASSRAKTHPSNYNHVIVQLEAEPLAHRFGPGLADELLQRRARSEGEARDGGYDPDNDSLVHETNRYSRLLVTRNEHARRHVAQMEHEQATFLAQLGLALGLDPDNQPHKRAQEAKQRYVARLYDHAGEEHEAIFSITLHGLALHVPDQFQHEPDQFIDLLKRLPHVRNVARGRRMIPQLYNAGDFFLVLFQTAACGNNNNRGPSVLHTLKPDITAPGVMILAQGYGPDPEARNMGFGVESGTSFATPVVAGAAALMKQVWPAWTPKQIKAAFMASAKWKNMTSQATGLAAQPLDMGAGNLNVAGAMDPGALLDPPSLSFSFLAKGLHKTIQVSVWSAANTTQVYDVTSVFTGPGSADDYSTPVSGITFTPAQITLAPGATAWINVTFDSSSDGVTDGDNQGFIVLTSENYEVHMPLWARVLRPANSSVLILNAMGSSDNATVQLYLHSWALNELGFSSVIQDVITTNWTAEADLVWLSTFSLAFLLTGNNGIESVETIPMSNLDLLRQWTVMGGKLFASGLIVPSLTNSSNKDIRLVNYLANFDQQKQRGCVDEDQAYTSVQSTPQAPDAFQQLSVPLRDTYSRRCLFELEVDQQPESGTSDADMVLLYPREVLPLLRAGNITVVVGKRAQPSQKRPGLRFPWATVTSVLGLDMLPQDSRVPFIAAVLGYLMEDVSLDIAVAQTSKGLLSYAVSFNSSVPEAIRAQFPEADKLAPTYVIHYGDGHNDTYTGTADVDQGIVFPEEHCYASAGSYNVTVEAVSPFGTGAVRQQTVLATEACSGTGSLRAPLAFVLKWLVF